MPLGFERLNERRQRPNPLINFIRPLPGSDHATSQDYLERIAAICYPVMKSNCLAVMALEEFPPNREFWGRNFNAGEVVQLVLKSLDGRWLPFKHVQMVMMHELAHIHQMNHSRAFWNVRNKYAGELQELWKTGYTGEGLWGKGRGLADGKFMRHDMPEAAMAPASICGGVYESRRKRKKKEKDTTLEERRAKRKDQKKRRILKKFGAGGTELGADEDTRGKLEGVKAKGKPKVAASKRARDLRAAAALARFEQSKSEPEELKEDSESETESDFNETDLEADVPEADRKRLNAEGVNLIRICNDADQDEEDVKQEMKELTLLDFFEKDAKPALVKEEDSFDVGLSGSSSSDKKRHTSSQTVQPKGDTKISGTCSACSFQNGPHTPVCEVCSNVLLLHLIPDHWQCTSDSCNQTGYINLGDNAICSICGERRK
jgi:hypothetical protein